VMVGVSEGEREFTGVRQAAALMKAVRDEFDYRIFLNADHTHSIAGATPVLALDMYEHSYHMDYGAAAAKYVDAFMENIHWDYVSRLHQQNAR